MACTGGEREDDLIGYTDNCICHLLLQMRGSLRRIYAMYLKLNEHPKVVRCSARTMMLLSDVGASFAAEKGLLYM